jgi:hypothetical protein
MTSQGSISQIKQALVRVVKNSRVHKKFKASFAKHLEIIGHEYLTSEKALTALDDDLIKLGTRIKENAAQIMKP